MNKQIISLMCIAILLAFALVVANEKWPDGYRTAPQVSVDTAPVGAVVKGPVTLPEEKPLAEESHAQDGNDVADASSADMPKKEGAPQGELVAIDSGTLRSDVASMPGAGDASQTGGAQSGSNDKKPAQSQEKEASQKQASDADKSSAAKPETQPAAKKESTPPPTSGTLGKATPKILLYTQEAVLEIKATGPIRCKTFKLISPNRLVVDLIGKWSVPVPTVPSNTIIQRVRVGEAPERTRIVLDLKRALKVDKIVQVNATTINVRMQ